MFWVKLMAVKLFCGMINGFQMIESAKLCTTKQHCKQYVPPTCWSDLLQGFCIRRDCIVRFTQTLPPFLHHRLLNFFKGPI